ncbi:MAG: UDP-glucose 4-epimerase GalE [Erysipelotrichaceae bacterium]|jgi:UDP-glucose 4-epimerase|nr:UDP-glucose 4-epimerase GalE [Erysipelotrichaceae bacterium]
MAILVTGGTGYIGSHTVVELLKSGEDVIIVDNLSNSSKRVLNKIYKITGKKPTFYEFSVQNAAKLEKLFDVENISDVIHFAGLKSVGESHAKPKLYYRNNVISTKVLLDVMKKHNVKNIVFSSSATVYGTPKRSPIPETDPIGEANSPYGNTKIEIERILNKSYGEDKNLNIAILRYFNPIGADKSGLIGELPKGIPNNLMPYITQVAFGLLPHVNVFGSDYKTIDGTGVRDYIHVVDLALGHIAALKKIREHSGLVIYNLGTGRGTSVLELIKAFEKANHITIPYEIKPRRIGDIDECYADASKAFRELDWKANLSIEDACRDSWNFQKKLKLKKE